MKILVVLFILAISPLTMASESTLSTPNTIELNAFNHGKKKKKARRHKRINKKRKRKCSAHAKRVFAG